MKKMKFGQRKFHISLFIHIYKINIYFFLFSFNIPDEILTFCRLTFNQIGGICFDKRFAKIPVAWTWSKCNVKPIMVAIYMVNFVRYVKIHR